MSDLPAHEQNESLNNLDKDKLQAKLDSAKRAIDNLWVHAVASMPPSMKEASNKDFYHHLELYEKLCFQLGLKSNGFPWMVAIVFLLLGWGFTSQISKFMQYLSEVMNTLPTP